MSILFLVAAIVGALHTWNAYRPVYRPAAAGFFSFMAGWLTAELALHHILWQAAAVWLWMRLGALDTIYGEVGLAITAASWLGLLWLFWSARSAGAVTERAIDQATERVGWERLADPKSSLRWGTILRPFPIGNRLVARTRSLTFRRAKGLNIKLDVYRHRRLPTGAPVLIYVHGGGWVIGSKKHQGLPISYRMAAQGWTVLNVNYRLSPHATFPEQLNDVKAAVTWIRQHAHKHGADPSFVAICGGSAGGHLATLAALTGHQSDTLDGQAADTSIQACVSYYGIYDLLDRHEDWWHPGMKELIEHHVLKAAPAEEPARWSAASPLDQIHADAPPFLVVHGDRDSLAPVEGARRFAASLGAVSTAPVALADLPGAQHAFEIFPSLRSNLVNRQVARFLDGIHTRHQDRKSTPPVNEAPAALDAP